MFSFRTTPGDFCMCAFDELGSEQADLGGAMDHGGADRLGVGPHSSVRGGARVRVRVDPFVGVWLDGLSESVPAFSLARNSRS